jgi:hypothetical protein
MATSFKFWLGPFQWLCRHCHDSTKRFIELKGYRPDIGIDGRPLDPRHPIYSRGGDSLSGGEEHRQTEQRHLFRFTPAPRASLLSLRKLSIVTITDTIIGDVSWLSLGDFPRDIHPP